VQGFFYSRRVDGWDGTDGSELDLGGLGGWYGASEGGSPYVHLKCLVLGLMVMFLIDRVIRISSRLMSLPLLLPSDYPLRMS
jgi:hypothetical protein